MEHFVLLLVELVMFCITFTMNMGQKYYLLPGKTTFYFKRCANRHLGFPNRSTYIQTVETTSAELTVFLMTPLENREQVNTILDTIVESLQNK